MMAEKHPDEITLLSFVEQELGEDARRDVGEHLVACRACAEQVRRLEAGGDVLQAAPLLELPEGRREEIIAALPERRDPWRMFRPAKRILVIAAPVAAAAALAGVFVVAGSPFPEGGGDNESAAESADAGGQGAAAEDMSTRAAQAQTPQTLDKAPPNATFVRFAQGPPAAVVRALGEDGIEAEVDPDGNVVADARPVDVDAALADRPEGDVPVYVR
jgi:hypothetical protein